MDSTGNLKNEILEYYYQEYNDDSTVILAIKNAITFYREKIEGLIVCVSPDRNLMLPYVVEINEQGRYIRINNNIQVG